MLKFLLRHITRFLLITGVTLVIVVALLTGLLRLGLPYASTYKNEVEAWVSNYLRTPVELGRMELAWNGFSPRLDLHDIAIRREGDQRVDVKLDRIMLDLNLYKSIFTGDLQINEVTLSGADLSLEYVGRQKFMIRGYALPGVANNSAENKPGNDSSLDVYSWLMSAGRVGLLESRLRLIDRERGIDYQIADIDIRAENSRTLHKLRISMVLPEQMGEKLEIDLDLRGTADTLKASNGKFYARVSAMNLGNWARIWPDRPAELNGGANVEFWGSWSNNELLSLRAMLEGNDVNVLSRTTASVENPAAVLAASPPHAHYSSVSTDIFWQRGAMGWRAEVDKLDFTYGESVTRIRSALLASDRTSTGKVYRFEGQGKLIDLGSIGSLLSAFDSNTALRNLAQVAAGTQARGRLQDWQADAQFGAIESPQLNLQAKVADVSWLAFGKIPGVSNLTGRLALKDNRGNFDLDAPGLTLDLPNLFSTPVAVESARGLLAIDLQQRDKLLVTENLFIGNPGLSLVTGLVLGRDDENDWHADLQAAASLDTASKVRRYLPDRLLKPRLHNWLTAALVDGEVTAASALLYGKLKDFPYENKPGLFQAKVEARNTTFKFQPDWPAGTSLTGRAEFTGLGMSFEVDSGLLSGTQLKPVSGGIASFRKPLLTLKGGTSGKLESFLAFAVDGPLQNLLKPTFEQSSGTGKLDLELALQVPLRNKAKREADEVLKVDGKVFTTNNTLVFDRFDVALSDINGAVAFSDSGMQIYDMDARFLDAPIKVSGQTTTAVSASDTTITAKGLLRADKVMQNYDIPAYPFFRGPALWDIALNVTDKGNGSEPGISLLASSDLVGTDVSLPQPLTKNSATARPVTVTGTFEQSGVQRWLVKNREAEMLIVAEPETGLKSMAIALGENEPRPNIEDGIQIVGKSATLSFDGWIESVSRMLDEVALADAAEQASQGATQTTADKPKPIPPVFADVRVTDLLVGETGMGPADFRSNTDGSYINTAMVNDHLRGNIRIPRAHWDKQQAVKARIAYADSQLLVALQGDKNAATGKGPEKEPEKPLDPRNFPRIEAHISNFAHKALRLKNLVLRTEPEIAGLKITTLGFANETAQLIGEGSWRVSDPQNVTLNAVDEQLSYVSLNLQSNDVGSTFEQAGLKQLMAEGRGSASLNLSWQGPAYKPDIASLTGETNVYLKDGRILTIDPGAARLVGLIALRELPRRLSLDFRDLVKGGLDYERISGRIKFKDGLANLEPFSLEGPIGVVEVLGQTDLRARTFDQSIRVLPRVSAALPIIGLIAGGASAGVGALLVTPVLKKLGIDFDRIGLTEYSLKGTWDKPLITRITPLPVQLQPSDSH